jgi:hypothetical protein
MNLYRRNCLDGDGSFRFNRVLETIKKKSWGDRQVDRIKFATAFASRGAPLRPARRPSFARSRRRVARSRQALRASRTVIGYDDVSTPRDLAPSVLNRIALRELRWIPLAVAHTPTFLALDLVCAWLWRLYGAWVMAFQEWLLLAAAVATQCVQMPQMTAGTVHERGPCGDYIQDRALSI